MIGESLWAGSIVVGVLAARWRRQRLAASGAGLAATSHYDIVCDTAAAGIRIRKYRSRRTGLTVVLADAPGPLVNGHLLLATEANEDAGLPHTLEHLVFLGSKRWPYKGLMDLLANRCLAQGTNAWTDTDHTCYTLTTAGSEGFLNILPVYMDHVLYPTLTDDGFLTEVHHITDEGKDAGVVYCEMQGRENSGWSLSYRALQLALFPDTGHRFETGGIMADLRVLEADTVRAYHRAFYRPENLSVIVVGQVQPQELLLKLAEFEDNIDPKAWPDHKRPWQTPIPPLRESITREIEFPDDDESNGLCFIAAHGPAWTDFRDRTGMHILWTYLTDSAISPLRQALVEIDDPVCSDVGFYTFNFSTTATLIEFSNPPVDKISELKPRYFAALQDLERNGFDMKRLADVIDVQILQWIKSVEEAPTDSLIQYLIGDFLYGSSPSDLGANTNAEQRLRNIKALPEQYWHHLLRTYILNQPSVCVCARPSSALVKSMADTEDARVAAQRDALGADGLAACKEALDKANDANNAEPPAKVFDDFQVPDASKVPLIDVVTYKADGAGIVGADTAIGAKIESHLWCDTVFPSAVQFDHVPSQFVQFAAFFDTARVPDELRPLLALYKEMVFELPIACPDRGTMPYEEVVTRLQAETVSYSSTAGVNGSTFTCGSFAQLLCISVLVDKHQYTSGARWLRNLLWHVQFTPERVRVVASRLSHDLKANKRVGRSCVRAAERHLMVSADSNHNAIGIVRQETFLKDVLADPAKYAGMLEQLVASFVSVDNMLLHIVCDVAACQNPVGPLLEHFYRMPSPGLTLSISTPESKRKEQLELERKQAAIKNPALFFAHTQELRTKRALQGSKAADGYKQGVVVPVAAIESGFLIRNVPGPKRFDDYNEIAQIALATEYLITTEGPMWKEIRGLGLAYGYGMQYSVEEGMLYLSLYRATDVPKALAKALQIVREFAEGTRVFDPVQLDAARSSCIFSIIAREETILDAADQSIFTALRRVPAGHNKRLLKAILDASLDDVVATMKKYFTLILDNDQATTCVAVKPKLVDEVIEQIKQAGGPDLVMLRLFEEGADDDDDDEGSEGEDGDGEEDE